MSITAKLEDGLLTVNVWELLEGSLTFTQQPELLQAQRDSGLPQPTTFDRYTEVYFDDCSQMK